MINGIPEKDVTRFKRIYSKSVCSICKKPFMENDFVFTYTGYKDENGHGKIHITAENCCAKKLRFIVMIGVYGPHEDPRFKTAIMGHPLKDYIVHPDRLSKTKLSH